MDKRRSLCHAPSSVHREYGSEAAEIEGLHPGGKKVRESSARRLFWASASQRRPRKPPLVTSAARRCLRGIWTYFSTSRQLSAAIFNTLIALRRLSGTSLYYQ